MSYYMHVEDTYMVLLTKEVGEWSREQVAMYSVVDTLDNLINRLNTYVEQGHTHFDRVEVFRDGEGNAWEWEA